MTLPTVVVVTGTDTDVGKTVVTAAIAAVLAGSGRRVAVYKPAQTGVAPDEPGDVAEVTRLAGVGGSEGVRLLAPMAPRAAAALEGAALPGLADHVAAVRDLASSHDHVLVEGAGGLVGGEPLAGRSRGGVVPLAQPGGHGVGALKDRASAAIATACGSCACTTCGENCRMMRDSFHAVERSTSLRGANAIRSGPSTARR